MPGAVGRELRYGLVGGWEAVAVRPGTGLAKGGSPPSQQQSSPNGNCSGKFAQNVDQWRECRGHLLDSCSRKGQRTLFPPVVRVYQLMRPPCSLARSRPCSLAARGATRCQAVGQPVRCAPDLGSPAVCDTGRRCSRWSLRTCAGGAGAARLANFERPHVFSQTAKQHVGLATPRRLGSIRCPPTPHPAPPPKNTTHTHMGWA